MNKIEKFIKSAKEWSDRNIHFTLSGSSTVLFFAAIAVVVFILALT